MRAPEAAGQDREASAAGSGSEPARDYVTQRNLNREPLWPGKGPLLGHLDIELTERCNNACVHCCINLPADDARARARELSTEEWQGILRQAADLGALSVRFTGGEPLLREDFQELYLFARRLGLKVLLFTNARLITPALADLLARVPPLEKIEITVYGLHPASYEAVTRAPGSYAEFRRGVELLLERQVPFIVKAALLPPNKGELDEFAAWAATIPGMDGPLSYAMFFELRGRRDSEARNRQIASLRLSPEEGLAVLTQNDQSYRRGMAEFCSRFMGTPGERLFTCGAGCGGCVDAYGMLQLCMAVRDPALAYDLRQGTLREALLTVFPRLRELVSANPQYLARCARCFLHGLCEQCPGKSWSEHGTLDTPVEYLCQVAHAQARHLGLLAAGERAWEVPDGPARVRKMDEGVKGA
jgi:MoaA/NifB/PqqE/SkfB family radical SAM enzyme